MWKDILKESRTVKFTPSLKYGILKYVNDNIPEGTVISFKELSIGEPFEQIMLVLLTMNKWGEVKNILAIPQ